MALLHGPRVLTTVKYDNTNLLREVLEGAPLTDREIEVLQLSAEGLTAIEVGKRLFLATETIRGYKKRAIYKLMAKNVTHAVTKAIRQGLIT